MAQVHTMVYEAVVENFSEGVPVVLDCLNDKFIKPEAAYGKAHLYGILANVYGYSTGSESVVNGFVEVQNSNDIRSTKFPANIAKYVNSTGNYVNPKCFDKDTPGWMEGNMRELREQSTNSIQFIPFGNGATTGGAYLIQVLVYVIYDRPQNGIAPGQATGQFVVTYDLGKPTESFSVKEWHTIYDDDPGFIPGAAYAPMNMDFQTASQPLGLLVRIRNLSTMGGLEVIVPSVMYGVNTTGQFLPPLIPSFMKQNINLSVRCPLLGSANGTYKISDIAGEFVTNRNTIGM